MKAQLIATERIAAETAGFTFELSDRFDFEAGQACEITLQSPRYQDSKGTTRTFSIASSPADAPRLLVATRLTGSAFKRSLLEAPVGLEVDVEGPSGSFVLQGNTAKQAVFLAGGIGITPFRSIIKDAADRRLPHRLTLLYANRTPGSTAFLSDLEGWQQRLPSFRLVPIFSEFDGAGPSRYETGTIDAAFITRHVGDVANAIHYIAGPPAFVKGMRLALVGAGADRDDIRTEEFSGY